MSYRVLALDPYSKHMSLPVLKAIEKLVKDGATVAGAKPTDDPSLADDQAEFDRINYELVRRRHRRAHGGQRQGLCGQSLGDVFNALKLPPDFDYTKPRATPTCSSCIASLADGDLYFVDNRSDRDETVDATFRVTGKAPELWHAETGKSKPASYKIADGRTTVPLHLEPWGTVFVVFRKTDQPKPRTTSRRSPKPRWPTSKARGR